MKKMKKNIFLFSLFFMLSIYFSTRISISNTPSSYVPPHLDSSILNDKIRDYFGSDEYLFLIFKGDKIYEHSFLSGLKKFENTISENENIDRVKSVLNFEFIENSDDSISISNIIEIDERQIVHSHLQRPNHFLDFLAPKDLSMQGILIRPTKLTNSFARYELVDEIVRSLPNDLRENFVGIAGPLALDVEQFKEMLNIIKVVGPLTMIVASFILYLLFPCFKIVGLFTVLNIFIVQCCVSFFTIFDLRYNMISSIIPSLVMAINISFVIHLLSALSGWKTKDEFFSGLIDVRRPALFSCLTTSVGLLSLCMSDIPSVRYVGLISSFGVLLSYYCIFFILPFVILSYDLAVNEKSSYFNELMSQISIKLGMIAISHSKYVLLVFTIVFLFMVPNIRKVHVESDLYRFFNDKHIVNIMKDLVNDKLSGALSVDLVFENVDFEDPKTLNSILRFQKDVEAIKGVKRSFSFTNILLDVHNAFEGGSDKFLPDNRSLIEQYMFVYSGKDLDEFLFRGTKLGIVSVSLSVTGANEIERVLEEISLVGDRNNIYFKVTGGGKLISDQEDLLVSSVVKSLLLSLFIIFVIFLLLWKSLKDALLTMLPNVFPILFCFSIMPLFNIWLDLGTAMIFSVTVGIAVDDTIHYFHNFRNSYKNGKTIDQVIMICSKKSGKAVMLTTFLLCLQIGGLCFSNFLPVQNFGVLTIVGLLVALIFDVLVLPAIIKLIARQSSCIVTQEVCDI